jgi:iron(III) transport system permease protein
LVLFLLLIYPLLRLSAQPFLSGQIEELFARLTQSTSLVKSFKNTLYFSCSVTFFSVVLGVLLAWLITRTNFPAKKHFKTWLSLPYAIPPFIGAISWIYLANPTNGLLNQILQSGFFNIYSMPGLIFIESTFLYTFVFISACSALELMDPSFEEAARTSGANNRQTFFKVSLPLILPSVLNSALLVFLASFASFGVPALIGGPAGLKVITTEIYQLQKMGTMSALQTSILLSSLLLIFSICVICFLQFFSLRKKYSLVSGKSARASLIDLKASRPFFLIFVVLYLGVCLFMPFFGIFLSATSLQQGTLKLSNFTLNHFNRILLETEELGRALKNSLIIATSVGFICSFFALLLGYIQTQTRSKLKPVIDLFVSIPYAAPGTVIALALIISLSQNFFGLPFSIYNTIWMFLIAYTLKYLNFSFKIVTDNYKQIHAHLIEAARTSGASLRQVVHFIWIPLLKPSLIASFFLVFVPSLSELTMSVFLTGPGLETIGTLIFQMQEYSDNIGGGASVLSLFIFIFVLLTNFFIKKASKGLYGL